jgi:hypothetical protein
MKTAKAVELAGGPKALADLLGITQSAVSQWGEDIPKPRDWQLRVLKPQWFAAPAKAAPRAKAKA